MNHDYDNIYHEPPEYYDTFFTDDYVDQTFSRILREVKDLLPRTRILEMCCGTGFFAHMLSAFPGIDYTGVDINAEFLESARERLRDHDSFHFFCSDVMTFEPSGRYDVVFLVNAYHHVVNEKKSALLKKIHDGLVDGGTFVLYDMLIRLFDDGLSFAEANREFYEKRIAWMEQHESPTEEEIAAWRNICDLSARGEDEYKVFYDYVIDDLREAGFKVNAEIRTWPEETLFDNDKIGDFLFLAKREDTVL